MTDATVIVEALGLTVAGVVALLLLIALVDELTLAPARRRLRRRHLEAQARSIERVTDWAWPKRPRDTNTKEA